jgi:hypothetical protein
MHYCYCRFYLLVFLLVSQDGGMSSMYKGMTPQQKSCFKELLRMDKVVEKWVSLYYDELNPVRGKYVAYTNITPLRVKLWEMQTHLLDVWDMHEPLDKDRNKVWRKEKGLKPRKDL